MAARLAAAGFPAARYAMGNEAMLIKDEVAFMEREAPAEWSAKLLLSRTSLSSEAKSGRRTLEKKRWYRRPKRQV